MNFAAFAEHERVIDELLRLLGSGSFFPGAYFPTLHMLTTQLHATPDTVATALEELQNRGLLVAADCSLLVAPAIIHRSTRKMNSISEAMARQGLTVTSRVLSHNFCEASKEVAGVLQLPLGAQVFRLVRIRSINNEPMLLESSYLPAERFVGVEQYDYGTTSLYTILKEKYDTIPSQQDLEFELEAPSEYEQRLLCLTAKSLLLISLGHTRDQNGRPMEYSISKSGAHRFLYESLAELGGTSLLSSTSHALRQKVGVEL